MSDLALPSAAPTSSPFLLLPSSQPLRYRCPSSARHLSNTCPFPSLLLSQDHRPVLCLLLRSRSPPPTVQPFFQGPLSSAPSARSARTQLDAVLCGDNFPCFAPLCRLGVVGSRHSWEGPRAGSTQPRKVHRGDGLCLRNGYIRDSSKK